MRKRLAKKIEKMRRKKVHEALEMVLEINTTQVRLQRVTGCKPTAFFSFSGHTAGISVGIYPDGWGKNCSWKHWCDSSYSDYSESMEQMLKRLVHKKKELQDAGKM